MRPAGSAVSGLRPRAPGARTRAKFRVCRLAEFRAFFRTRTPPRSLFFFFLRGGAARFRRSDPRGVGSIQERGSLSRAGGRAARSFREKRAAKKKKKNGSAEREGALGARRARR